MKKREMVKKLANNLKSKKNNKKYIITLTILTLISTIVIAGFVNSSKKTSFAPFPSKTAINTPIPRSTTAVETAKEAPNIPITDSEKIYYNCLLTSYNIVSASCKKAETIVSKEINVYGSNMVQKFKYEIYERKIYDIKNALSYSFNNNKILVNGVDYFSKKGFNELPQSGYLFNPINKTNILLKGIKIFIYDSQRTGKNFCISITSFDNKVTWKATWTFPNVYLGNACSISSLE